MENKKILLAVLLFLSLCFGVFAQESEADVEVPVTDNWQILEWADSSSEYVTKYLVEIEQLNSKSNEYETIISIETENNETQIAINPKLKPGVYRYRITSYDLLGFEGAVSDWSELKIFQAFDPEVRTISSNANHSSTVYLEEINDGIFTISGRNLFDLKEDDTDINFTDYRLLPKGTKKFENGFVPEILEHSSNNRELKIKLELSELDVGTYNFIAKDASGLENEKNSDSQITIRFKKLMDLDLAAGYLLPVTIFDDTIKTYFKSPVTPLSLTGKLTFIPLKHTWGYLGIGVQANYTRLFAEYDTHYIDGNMMAGMLNVVYQKPFNIKVDGGNKSRHLFTFEFHGGAGVVMFQDLTFHFPRDINSEPLNSCYIGADVGASVQTYITNRLYIEVNADFLYAFMTDMQLGQILPSVCVGFQF